MSTTCRGKIGRGGHRDSSTPSADPGLERRGKDITEFKDPVQKESSYPLESLSLRSKDPLACEDVYRSDPVGIESFAVDINQKTEEIRAILVEDETVRGLYERLVPIEVPYVAFWRRYFYVREQMAAVAAKEAAAHREGSSGQIADEYVGWDDADPVVSSARGAIGPSEGAEAAADKEAQTDAPSTAESNEEWVRVRRSAWAELEAENAALRAEVRRLTERPQPSAEVPPPRPNEAPPAVDSAAAVAVANSGPPMEAGDDRGGSSADGWD